MNILFVHGSVLIAPCDQTIALMSPTADAPLSRGGCRAFFRHLFLTYAVKIALSYRHGHVTYITPVLAVRGLALLSIRLQFSFPVRNSNEYSCCSVSKKSQEPKQIERDIRVPQRLHGKRYKLEKFDTSELNRSSGCSSKLKSSTFESDD